MYFAIFILALALTMVAIPWVLMMAQHWKLLDEPDNERKLHARATPALGGIGIMIGFLVSMMVIQGMEQYFKMGVLAICMVILTLVGLRDDLFLMKAQHKFLWQLAVALIFAGLMSHWNYSLRGFLGLQELPFAVGFALCVSSLIFFTNAYNLIDGVDGLAGTIGLWIALNMGLVSFLAGDRVFALLALAVAGSLTGFLRYNFAPAKIFMGDTGSLTIGFMLTVFALRFLTRDYYRLEPELLPLYQFAPLIVLSYLIIPIYDTLRVIIVRVLRRTSPFMAGRDHIHHELLMFGLNHKMTTIYFGFVNVLISLTALYMAYTFVRPWVILLTILLMCVLLLPTGGQKRSIWFSLVRDIIPLLQGKNRKKIGTDTPLVSFEPSQAQGQGSNTNLK